MVTFLNQFSVIPPLILMGQHNVFILSISHKETCSISDIVSVTDVKAVGIRHDIKEGVEQQLWSMM